MYFKDFKMNKKIFLISGGSSDIFQNFIKANYFNNSKVMAIFNSKKKLIRTKNIEYLKLDYTKNINLKKFEKIFKNYKKIIFINFASKKTNKIFLNINSNEFIRDIKINTLSYFSICQFIIPFMIKNNWGRIINISSTGGEKGDIGTTTYTSTKLASNGITNILSKEFARFGITSNTIKLGNFNTGMFTNLNENLKRQILKEIPSKKTGKFINIYKGINFLINSDYTNNAIINIDGGYR
jgi:NAD(P)-dependent dehydrogenase (short-subunit alcohol dehydrogenase family)